ncbi:endonuclease III [Candidatus Dependentiae bacterium]|nr:endonuclease III [Candidatus Dependentiae bacterium]
MQVDKKYISKLLRILDKEYPEPKTALNYSTPFELLIATILSAQSTDKIINQVTKELFKKYKKPEDFVKVKKVELESDIKKTGFFRNKAKSLIGCSKKLISDFNGNVPDKLEDLISLPGVGRKTANCVLGGYFGIPGIVVDTHVKRLANRLGLTEEKNPEKIEKDLMVSIPRKRWIRFSNQLIWHGRTFCIARKPKCSECPMKKICPSAFKIQGRL